MEFECKNLLDKLMVIVRAVGLVILYMFFSSLIGYLLMATPLRSTVIGTNIAFILAEAITTGLLILIFHKRFFKDFKNFKKDFKKNIKFALKCWLIGFILMMITNIIINVIINDGSIAANEAANRETLFKYPIYSILAMCIMAPICEELLFRASFKSAFKSIVTYSLFTGILFAGLHVATGIESWNISYLISHYQELLYFLPYSSLGIIFGYAFYKTNNIWTSISMHMFHNSLSVLLILLSV